MFFRGFESYKDAQTPRDHRVLQDMQVTQSGCGITTYSESSAGSSNNASHALAARYYISAAMYVYYTHILYNTAYMM